MKDLELQHLLSNASVPPDCPTDKFVSGFLAQMDADLAPVVKPRSNSRFLMFGSIAAALVVAVGAISMYQLNANFNQPKMVQNTQIAPADDAEIIAVIDKEIAADDFAAQLVGDEDISTIVPIGGKSSNP